MNNNSNDGVLLKVLLFGGATLFLYKVLQSIAAAIEAFLSGLVNIALVVAGVLAAYWVYCYISAKQFGEEKKEQKVQRIEKKRKEVTARLPRHLRPLANEYYIDQEREVYDIKPQVSLADMILERAKQVVGILRRKEGGK